METTFFLVKGLIALAAFLLILVDVFLVWGRQMSLGRRLRYWSLLLAAVFTSNASRIQIEDDLQVDQRAITGMVLAVLLLATGAVSLIEDRGTRSTVSSPVPENW